MWLFSPLSPVAAKPNRCKWSGEAIHEKWPKMNRPWWCQDPTCVPDDADTGAQIGSFDEHPEYSGFCCGQVPEPLEFERHGFHHRNDGHLCFRSALRGVVMLEVNAGDLQAVARVAIRGLRARGQDKFGGRWFFGPGAEVSAP